MENVTDFDFSSVTAGAVTDDGALYMWGYNDNGLFSGYSEEYACSPLKIMDNVAQFQINSTDSWARCSAITKDDDLYIWGDVIMNDGGGANEANEKYKNPVKMLENVSDFSMHSVANAAITNEGNLYMWGYRQYDNLAILPIVDDVSYVKLDDGTSEFSDEEGGWYLDPVQIDLTAKTE